MAASCSNTSSVWALLPSNLNGLCAYAKAGGVHQAIENTGCQLLSLPPCSPDFNPIENAFSKLKAHLQAKAERSVAALWNTVADIVKLFEPNECANYFSPAGYDPD